MLKIYMPIKCTLKKRKEKSPRLNTFIQATGGITDGGHLYPMAWPPTAGDPDVVTCQRWPDISIIIVNRA